MPVLRQSLATPWQVQTPVNVVPLAARDRPSLKAPSGRAALYVMSACHIDRPGQTDREGSAVSGEGTVRAACFRHHPGA